MELAYRKNNRLLDRTRKLEKTKGIIVNSKQTVIIAITILVAAICHAFITKPVPVVNNITIPETVTISEPIQIYPGRYQLSDGKLRYRFDTVTGKMYENTGYQVKYEHSNWRPLRVPGEELSLEDVKFIHPEVDVQKFKDAREKRNNLEQ